MKVIGYRKEMWVAHISVHYHLGKNFSDPYLVIYIYLLLLNYRSTQRKIYYNLNATIDVRIYVTWFFYVFVIKIKKSSEVVWVFKLYDGIKRRRSVSNRDYIDTSQGLYLKLSLKLLLTQKCILIQDFSLSKTFILKGSRNPYNFLRSTKWKMVYTVPWTL